MDNAEYFTVMAFDVEQSRVLKMIQQVEDGFGCLAVLFRELYDGTYLVFPLGSAAFTKRSD